MTVKERLSSRSAPEIRSNSHLELFYAQIGYKTLKEEAAPPCLIDRIQGYRYRNPVDKFIIMHRGEEYKSKGLHRRTLGAEVWGWRVEDLWGLASSLAVRAADPSTIIDLDRDGWFSNKTPTPGDILGHMKRIIAANMDHPVILAPDGLIMDGAHRACKALLNERKRIDVVQFKEFPSATWIEQSGDRNLG